MVAAFTPFLRQPRSLEACIGDYCSRFGPFVALTDPGSPRARVGAGRALVADEDWQSHVMDWMVQAQAIVLIAGRTSSLKWELAQALRPELRHKLRIFLPARTSFLDEEDELRFVETMAEQALGIDLENDKPLEYQLFSGSYCISMTGNEVNVLKGEGVHQSHIDAALRLCDNLSRHAGGRSSHRC